MSKHNKVNPGQYTQAGRLTPDDTAREVVKQRVTGSPRQVEGGDYAERVKARATSGDNSAGNDAEEDQNAVGDDNQDGEENADEDA